MHGLWLEVQGEGKHATAADPETTPSVASTRHRTWRTLEADLVKGGGIFPAPL